MSPIDHHCDPDPTAPGIRRQFAIEVLTRLREHGYQAYWAGGCVRDLLLGMPPDDYDIATSADPNQVRKLFRRTVAVGASFGVIVVVGGSQRGDVEVATFRSDGDYLDGRRPKTITFSGPEADAQRRDFTINGMFYDPIDEQVIDYVGGRADLQLGRIRAIGLASERFSEDKLRLLRAVRFASRFDFELEAETRAAVVAMADQIAVVAAERITHELRKMLVHPRRAGAIALTREVGLLVAILPQLQVILGDDDQAWSITLRTLQALPEKPGFPLALAALVHRAFGPGPEGREQTDDLARTLKLSNQEREQAMWLVEHHAELPDAPAWPRSRLKRLLASPGIEELLDLGEALARAEDRSRKSISWLRTYLRDQPDGPIDPPLLVTGKDLIAAGFRPGPEFSTWLERIRDAQLNGEVSDPATALNLVQGWAKI